MAESKVETRFFTTMCGTLSRTLAQKYEDVLQAEVGKVLEKALSDTPSAKAERLKREYANSKFTEQPPSLYTPKYGRKHVRLTKRGKILYNLSYNYHSDELWNRITQRRLANLAKKLGARGLAKKSWLKIAQALGLSVKAPGYVDNATPVTGRQYDDTSARKQNTSDGINITLTNAQPTINTIGGARILQAAIDGRVKFFLQNMKRRVFEDVAKTAAKYPGIKVTRVT